jgi:acetate kinase
VAVLTRVLVLNAGSSSLKASVVEAGRLGPPLAATTVAWGSDATRVADRRATVERALEELWAQGTAQRQLLGSGHRVVHGGDRFRAPTQVDDAVLAELDELSSLAPLHNPVAVDTLRALADLLPDLPAVAAFDTAFHATLAPEAFVYPLPWHWYAEWGIRRFGFHGLSVEWSTQRSAELLGADRADLNIVVAHLGSGCSVTAVSGGRSVSTSMGMTPLEGLVMGTRSGSVDPGVLLHALREHGLSTDELAEVLDHGSGLLGMSGVSGDVREVQQAADGGSERARLALDIFVRRAAAGIAVAAVALPRLDALVFTGGIGEHATEVRSRICDRLVPLGIRALDGRVVTADALLTDGEAGPAVLRIEAREDLVIADAVAELLGPG